jgi:hypothetical protein
MEEATMTLEKAHDYIMRVIIDAAIAIGAKKKLAEHFGVRPAAVSQWLKRRRFPAAMLWEMHRLVADRHKLEDIQRALFLIEYSPERQRGA